MLDSLVSLLLLLHCTAVTVSQNCTEEGAVEIIGTVTPTLIAGRLEICVNGTWRAVYDNAWGNLDVQLVCKERGFPLQGAEFCTKSCFGSSNRQNGMSSFICKNAETFRDFQNVTTSTPHSECLPSTTATPHHDYMPLPTTLTSLSCDCSNCSMDNHNTTTTSHVNASFMREMMTTTALSLTLLLTLLILVGVVIGWVWSSCRRRRKSASKHTLDNPIYTSSLPTSHISTGFSSQYSTVGPGDTPTACCASKGEYQQYSTVGPRDMPTACCAPEGGYQVVGHDNKAEYEVPFQRHTEEMGQEETMSNYNILQHH